MARISREMGVQRFLHISTLNCNPDPPENIIPGGSGFYRSKVEIVLSILVINLNFIFQYYGELAVREEFPKAVIIRPAEIYSEHPTFFFENWLHWCKLIFSYKFSAQIIFFFSPSSQS